MNDSFMPGHTQRQQHSPPAPTADEDDARATLMSGTENQQSTHVISDSEVAAAGVGTDSAHDGVKDTSGNKKRPSAALAESGKRSIYHWVWRLWLWETGACVLSLVCLAVIVGVLRYEDGQQLDQWDLFIPPNAVISFIATLAKSSFLLVVAEILSQLKWLHFHQRAAPLYRLQQFDAASRGPLGAARMLFVTRTPLSLLAALTALLALLVDPFVQLVLTFPSQSVADLNRAAQATFKIATGYDTRSSRVEVALADSMVGGSIPGNMKTAAMGCIYNSSCADPPDVPTGISCPSGNCTWTEPVVTLGICSSCTNITSHLTRACHDEVIAVPYSDGSPRTVCNYTFPSGTVLSATTIKYTRTGDTGSTLWSAVGTSHNGTDETQPPDHGPATIVRFAALQFPDLAPEATDIPQANGWTCEFRFCEKSFARTEVIQGNISLPPPIESELTILDHINGIDGAYSLRPTKELDNPSAAKYTVYDDAWSILGNFLGLIVSTSYHAWTGVALNSNPYSDSTVDGNSSYLALIDAGYIDAVFASTSDVDAAVRHIAHDMTDALRALDRTTTGTVLGTTFQNRTFIHVRWAWLALPIALVVLTCVLLLAVALQTSASALPAWKSNSLPLLFQHPPPHAAVDLPTAANPSALQTAATKIVARIGQSGEMTYVERDRAGTREAV